jgi:hypothetical protein
MEQHRTAKSKWALLCVAAASLALSGCVAALVPIAAGGIIAKKQIDGRSRARKAEAAMEQQAASDSTVQTSGEVLDTQPVIPQQQVNGADTPAAMRATERLLFSNVRHPYLAMIIYALEQAERRRAGEAVRSAVLIEDVSLADPKVMECGGKQLAVIIDLDEAKDAGAPAAVNAGDLSVLLETLREADIRIAWLSGDNEGAVQSRIAALQLGDAPAIKNQDLILFARKGGLRKQERRWELAKDHCVLAIAGDRNGDFDELYDYLRKADLAIRLEAFANRGWFNLPAPTRALGL